MADGEAEVSEVYDEQNGDQGHEPALRHHRPLLLSARALTAATVHAIPPTLSKVIFLIPHPARRQSVDHRELGTNQARLARYTRLKVIKVLSDLMHQHIAADLGLGTATFCRQPATDKNEL
jgi:hypothetical protein